VVPIHIVDATILFLKKSTFYKVTILILIFFFLESKVRIFTKNIQTKQFNF